MGKREGRPGAIGKLGTAKTFQFLRVFDTAVLKAELTNGARITAPVWCIDNSLPNARTRTVHTQAGRVKIPADFVLFVSP